MITKDMTIVNEIGLHARPAAVFCGAAKKFSCEVTIRRVDNGLEANAKEMTPLLKLDLFGGDKIQLITDGEDEAWASRSLSNLVAGGFGEPLNDWRGD